MIYSFANCALNTAPFLRRWVSVETSITNMRTDGILRMLAGESFTLCDQHKQRLFASDPWKEFVVNNCLENDPALHACYDFHPFEIREDDVFLWSPFADCLCSFTEATCDDGTFFPFMHRPVVRVFPSRGRVPFTSVEALWHQLARKTAHVQRKGVVLYDPTTLVPEAQTQKSMYNTIDHIRFYNDRARAVFAAYGWKIFSPKPIAHEVDPYWAHYHDDAKHELCLEIADVFQLSHDEWNVGDEEEIGARQLIF